MKNQIQELCTAMQGICTEIILQNEQDRKDAGVIPHEEAEAEKNLRAFKKARAEDARREIIRVTGVKSHCCESAVINNINGTDICADCLEACGRVKV